MHDIYPMTPEKLNDINYFISQAGLKTSYTEHFACPPKILSDSIFVAVRLTYQPSPNKPPSITSLSGCILKEELNIPFVGVFDKTTRGAWILRARELLPGPRFETAHVEIKNWWAKVEKLCENAANSAEVILDKMLVIDRYD